MLTVVIGLVCQVAYAHFVNAVLDAIGVSEERRAGLTKYAEAGVPMWIVVIGFGVRACFLVGIVLPILTVVGLLR